MVLVPTRLILFLFLRQRDKREVAWDNFDPSLLPSLSVYYLS